MAHSHVVDIAATKAFAIAEVLHLLKGIVEAEHATLRGEQVVPLHIIDHPTTPFVGEAHRQLQLAEVGHLPVGVECLRARAHEHQAVVPLRTAHPGHLVEEPLGEGGLHDFVAAHAVQRTAVGTREPRITRAVEGNADNQTARDTRVLLCEMLFNPAVFDNDQAVGASYPQPTVRANL